MSNSDNSNLDVCNCGSEARARLARASVALARAEATLAMAENSLNRCQYNVMAIWLPGFFNGVLVGILLVAFLFVAF